MADPAPTPDRRRVRAAPIAGIGPDRHVHVVDVHGEKRAQTAGGQPGVMWGWWDDGIARASHAWPTWSPDGRRLACFATDDEGRGEVLVLDVDGVASTAVAHLEDRLPIYLFWSAAGDRLAILTQRLHGSADRLCLGAADPDQAGSEIHVAEGTPLFFTWAGTRLAAFVGEPRDGGSRLALLAPDGGADRRLLPGHPGNFCAPVWIDERLVYVLQDGPVARVVASGLDEPEPRVIESLTGLVALLGAPRGGLVARAVAPGGDGTPYRDLSVIDPASGRVTAVHPGPCLAFLWLPDSSGLVTARVDTEANLMRWQRVDLDGTVTPLCDMYPTRDFGFFLRFFEQYAQSHPMVAPDGRHLLVSGGLEGHGDPHRVRALWEVPLDGGEPRRVMDGLFGVYGPPVP